MLLSDDSVEKVVEVEVVKENVGDCRRRRQKGRDDEV